MSILPDILEPGLTTVFCGSAASSASARLGAYYAGPGNRFWQALYEGGLTSSLLTPTEFRRLPQFGIGITDLAKHESGMDISLYHPMPMTQARC
jgi:TDG/mug DNA glycosylase family protein